MDSSMKFYDERSIMLAWAAEKLKDEIEESILDEEDYRKIELGVNLVERRESAKNLCQNFRDIACSQSSRHVARACTLCS